MFAELPYGTDGTFGMWDMAETQPISESRNARLMIQPPTRDGTFNGCGVFIRRGENNYRYHSAEPMKYAYNMTLEFNSLSFSTLVFPPECLNTGYV